MCVGRTLTHERSSRATLGWGRPPGNGGQGGEPSAISASLNSLRPVSFSLIYFKFVLRGTSAEIIDNKPSVNALGLLCVIYIR